MVPALHSLPSQCQISLNVLISISFWPLLSPSNTSSFCQVPLLLARSSHYNTFSFCGSELPTGSQVGFAFAQQLSLSAGMFEYSKLLANAVD